MCYVYILKSINFNKTYTGSTCFDLIKRLSEHNAGSNKYTSRFKPWRIIYQEEFKTRKEAQRREKYLKSHTGRKLLKTIINNLSNCAPE